MKKIFIGTFFKIKMILSDKYLLLAMTIIPIFIILASGSALRYQKLNIIPIGVADEDNSKSSTTIIKQLSAKEGLKVYTFNRKNGIKNINNNKIESLFIIKKGFEIKILKEEDTDLIDFISNPSSFSGSFVSEIISSETIRLLANSYAVNTITSSLNENNKNNAKNTQYEITEYMNSLWIPKPLMTISYKEIQGQKIIHPKKIIMPFRAATSTGIIVVFIMFYILFNSSWLIEERLNGTLIRLASISGGIFNIFMSNIFALLFCGSIQILVFSLIQKLIFNIDLIIGFAFAIIFAFYILAVISISIFLSTILKTPSQLQAGAPLFALDTSFIGGCFWNLVDIPENMKKLSLITPQGWAIKGINNLLIGTQQDAFWPIIVLLSISLILLPVSFYRINKQVSG